MNELETSLTTLGDVWSTSPANAFARFVEMAAHAMLANVGLKRSAYEAMFLSQPETVQTQLDVTFKILVDTMNT